MWQVSPGKLCQILALESHSVEKSDFDEVQSFNGLTAEGPLLRHPRHLQ